MKKPASKKETYTGGEMKRYLGALHEEHMGGLKAIGEQFVDVNRKLNEHTRLLNSHTEMIGKLAVDVEVVKTDVRLIKNDLKQKVGRDEFVALELRVSRIESKVR